MGHFKSFENREFINIFSLKHLALQLKIPVEELLAVSGDIDQHYKLQLLKQEKKDGSTKIRNIYHPSDRLTQILKAIDRRLLKQIKLVKAVHGARHHHSNVTNAKEHVCKKYVQNIDIKDFYPNVRSKIVYQTFIRLQCSPDVARCLTRLCTADNHLPQGYNTSPRLANLVLTPAIERIDNLCEQQALNFSILADDLTISGNKNPARLLRTIEKILGQYGFKTNEKTVLKNKEEQQIVTGVVVNKKLNIPDKEYRSLRRLLHECQQKRPCDVMSTLVDRQKRPFDSVEKFRRHVEGRIGYLAAINPLKASRLKTTLAAIHWDASA
jgi:RNA-directed DNA polymerase